MSVVDKLADLNVGNPDKEILETAEAEFKNGDKDALRTILVALIRLDRYGAAARLVEQHKPTSAKYAVELAYIYYQTNQLEKLQQLAAEYPVTAVRLCLSQAEYRAGDYAAAAQALEGVSVSADETVDLIANRAAIAAAQGEPISEADATSIPAFDRHFNDAYAHLVSGNTVAAIESLSAAKQEAESEDERASAIVQAAYARALEGRPDLAKELLADADASDLTVANNKLALAPPQDLEEILASLREYDAIPDSLPAAQRSVLESNRLLLEARAGMKIDGKARSHAARFPNDLAPLATAALVAASAVSRPEHIEPQEWTVRQLRRARTGRNRVPATLALAQTLANEGKVTDAASVIIDLFQQPNTTLAPGILGAVVAALKLQGRDVTSAVSKSLKGIDLANGDYSMLAGILAQSSDAHDREFASLYFASLPEGTVSIAGQCAAAPEREDIEALASQLPPAADLAVGDAALLESQGLGPLLPPRVTKTVSRKRHRSGKPRLPADYDESKQPNPERWLAKEDRSDFKPKKKKGLAAAGAAQGATQGVAAAAQSPAPTSTVTTSSANKSKKQKKKKGKK